MPSTHVMTALIGLLLSSMSFHICVLRFLLIHLVPSDASYHQNQNARDRRRHLTARGFKTSDGLCEWGIHVYEDGSYSVKTDMGDGVGGKKKLDDVDYELVWAESTVSLRFFPLYDSTDD